MGKGQPLGRARGGTTDRDTGDLPIRVLHLSTSDSKGGAARAANRLHRALVRSGQDSRMLVLYKETDDDRVDTARRPSNLLTRAKRVLRRTLHPSTVFPPGKPGIPFTAAEQPNFLDTLPQTTGYDVVHLHWVAHFLNFSLLASLGSGREPLVWTLHDMNPGTGGCHIIYPGCERAGDKCGKCPGLGSDEEDDATRKTWLTKSAAYGSLNRPLRFVAPSDAARDEFLGTGLGRDKRVTVIPNAIDAEVYRPVAKREARKALGLPQDRFLVGASAFRIDNPIKGQPFLIEAVRSLGSEHAVSIVSIGGGTDGGAASVEHIQLGRMDDDSEQAKFYSAIDLFVHPSMWETFGLVVAEAMACGTPVVAFDIGALQGLVVPGQTGWLAKRGDSGDLAAKIAGAIATGEEGRTAMGERGRSLVIEKFSFADVARRHAVLYEELVREAKGAR